MARGQDDWAQWRAHVLQELKRLSEGISSVDSKIDVMHTNDIGQLKADIAVLQFKSGVWGFLAGAVPAVGVILYEVMKK